MGRKLQKSVEGVRPRVPVENTTQNYDGVGLERTARQIPKRRVAIERAVYVLVLACDVTYSLLGVEALDRFFYLIAEDFQLALEFDFRINRHWDAFLSATRSVAQTCTE